MSSQSRELILNIPGIDSIESSQKGKLKVINGQVKTRMQVGEILSFGDKKSFTKEVKGSKGERSYHFGLN